MNEGSWQVFASVMAASLVAHILSDPCVFRSWPHFEGTVICMYDLRKGGVEGE